MDPITHGLLGLGVASFSGQPLSLHSPVYLSALLGSLAPDFDLVMQLKGDLTYLKHHRGVSHSIPGSAFIVGLITVPLALAFPEVPFWTLFLWGWLGALSHCFIDIFNSYGSELLWPLYRRKISVNLLNIFDLYLFILLVVILYSQDTYPSLRGWTILLALVYVGLRYLLSLRIRRQLRRHYGKEAKRIIVMPALKGNWTWDVCVETKHNFIVGQMYSFSLMFNLREMLVKQQNNLIKAALDSKLGRLFKEFTPLFHVSLQPTENGYLVRFFDLRYHLRQQFLHTGTAVFNEECKLVEEIFSPYLGKRNIKIAS
ncbi:MAG TPA: metal-dependent hydrolase [Clostridia bacterium]|nr:metal-dependent hydrolase [Clostridia bacterium]